MKYNPAQAAVATYTGEGNFEVVDSAGLVLFQQLMSPAEVKRELDALRATGAFLQLFGENIFINTNEVSCVRASTTNQLIIEGSNARIAKVFTSNAATLDSIVRKLPEYSDMFVNYPDYLVSANYKFLQDVTLNDEGKLEFSRKNGAPWAMLSTSAEAAAPFIATAQAAIAACKAMTSYVPAKTAPALKSDALTAGEEKLKNLAATIKGNVFGQDEPVDLVVDAVFRSRALLQDDNKPIGSFLFLGPTGVGKTELARAVAEALDMDFKKIDMSEYMDKVSASRLTGGAPNYVGYEQGGELTNFIKKHPNSVILFDEIEKAHPDVANLLLQIMDDARLTDGKANVVKFNNTIIIMTSNLGSAELKARIGFDLGAPVERSSDARDDKAVQNYFLPEFVNRVTEVVRFKPLTTPIMVRMVDKFLKKLEKKLAKNEVTLTVDDAARLHLARKGYDRANGARPLDRLIDKTLATPLAREILFGALNEGGAATVTLDEKRTLKISFNDQAANDNRPDAAPLPAPTPKIAAFNTSAP